VAFSAERSQ